MENQIYIHIETGAEDTKEGWINSYDQDELDERGLTAIQAFEVDEDITLIKKHHTYKKGDKKMKTKKTTVTIPDDYGNRIRVQLPKQVWSGKYYIELGIRLEKLYFDSISGRCFARFYSEWSDRNDCCYGRYYTEKNPMDYAGYAKEIKSFCDKKAKKINTKGVKR